MNIEAVLVVPLGVHTGKPNDVPRRRMADEIPLAIIAANWSPSVFSPRGSKLVEEAASGLPEWIFGRRRQ
jgi:hypothetical protein